VEAAGWSHILAARKGNGSETLPKRTFHPLQTVGHGLRSKTQPKEAMAPRCIREGGNKSDSMNLCPPPGPERKRETTVTTQSSIKYPVIHFVKPNITIIGPLRLERSFTPTVPAPQDSLLPNHMPYATTAKDRRGPCMVEHPLDKSAKLHISEAIARHHAEQKQHKFPHDQDHTRAAKRDRS